MAVASWRPLSTLTHDGCAPVALSCLIWAGRSHSLVVDTPMIVPGIGKRGRLQSGGYRLPGERTCPDLRRAVNGDCRQARSTCSGDDGFRGELAGQG